MKKIKILLIYNSKEKGVCYYRSDIPHFKLVESFPNEFDLTWVDLGKVSSIINLPNDYNTRYDLVCYNVGTKIKLYNEYRDVYNYAKNFISLGAKEVIDIDDFWEWPNYVSTDQTFINRYKEICTHMLSNQNSYITTTNKYLANKIREFNTKVYIINNAIDTSESQFIPNKTSSKKLRLGLVLSSCHLDDVKLLSGVFDRLNKYNLLDKIELRLCGFNNLSVTNEIIPYFKSPWVHYELALTNNYKLLDKTYVNSLLEEYVDPKTKPITSTDSFYKRIWTKSVSEYATNYNDIDVLLSPLVDSEFNRCKSELKVIEAGCFSCPVIASKVEPYEKSIIDKESGILISKDDMYEWVKAIKYFIDNPSEVSRMGSKNNEIFLSKYTYDKTSALRRDVYNLILNN